MGYYNDFYIYADKNQKEVTEAVKEISGRTENEFAINSPTYCTGFNGKWCDWMADTQGVSLAVPDAEIEVHRIGEGVNEEWDEEKVTFKNGQIVKREILIVETRWETNSEEQTAAALGLHKDALGFYTKSRG